MKLLAISEHYFPRVGGTVNYVHETLCALAEQGVDIELIVPGPAPEEFLTNQTVLPYHLRWIDVGYPPKGDPSREQRYNFCMQTNAEICARLHTSNQPDVVHVMFGLFVMEVLETEKLQAAGVATFATVHNVPPMECRVTAHNAPLLVRFKEDARLFFVKAKNRTRLRRHAYCTYIVPSEQVAGLLRPIVVTPVAVIGHGPTSDLQACLKPPASRLPQERTRILTVAGYAPHKRQHLIPQVAARLLELGVDFQWDVVGPSGRVTGYYDSIASEVKLLQLDGKVTLHHAVPLATLAQLYDNANLYVQPSIEEGFCLTALDAAATGLPVIGCPAGALPAITAASGGQLVNSSAAQLADAISRFVRNRQWPDSAELVQTIRECFSWQAAAKSLLDQYIQHTHKIDDGAV